MANLLSLTRNIGITGTNLESFDRECGMLRTNALECQCGDTFICIKGERVDGHDLICTAVERGAELIVCGHVTGYLAAHPEIPYITVENTRLACANMWNEYCGRPTERLIFVAVTGTNGKTSTTYFLNEIFKRAGYVTGVIGTVRCLVGDKTVILSDSAQSNVNSMTTPTPEKLYPMLGLMADAGVEIVFMEASSHALAQYRLDPIRFTAGIFTGLTQDHLDYHEDMEAYYLAKKRLFELSGAAVVNVDDLYAKRLSDDIGIPYVTYSCADKAASYYSSDALVEQADGVSYVFHDKNEARRIKCPIAGSFTVSNTLAAASCARLFGIKADVIASALEGCPQIPGRMERVLTDEPLDFEIFIDYAHTPDALENVLKCLLAMKRSDGRLVAVFGCGGDRDVSKRPIMGRISTTLANLTVITGDNSRTENPRSIICDILKGAADGAECRVIERREKAIEYVIENHRPGDIILLAGKGHEDYEIDSSGKHPFSEKDIICRTLRRLYGR